MEVAVGICIAIGVFLAIWLYYISGVVLKLVKTTAALIRKVESDDKDDDAKVEKFMQEAHKRMKKGMSEEEAQKVLEELMKEAGLNGQVKAIKLKGKK